LSKEGVPERSWGRDYLCHGNPQLLISKKLLSTTKLERDRKVKGLPKYTARERKVNVTTLLSMGSPAANK